MQKRLGYRFQGKVDLQMGIEPRGQGPPTPTVVTAVARFAASTVVGSQDITTPDLNGLIPKAVIFVCSRAVTDGVAINNADISIGAATGAANEWVVRSTSEHGVAAGNSASEMRTDGCILICNPGSNDDIAKADFTGFIANGCTLNWSLANAAFLVTAIFFAGEDLTAHANHANLGNAVDGATDIMDPGFEPDLVIGAMVDFWDDAQGLGTSTSFGFCSNDGAGGVAQRCIATISEDGANPTEVSVISRNDSIVAAITFDNPSAYDWRGELGSFDASGFTCTTRDGGGNGAALGYLALSLGGAANFWVGTHSAPTAIGNNSDTGPGFTPQLVLRGMTQAAIVNTIVDSGDGSGSFGFSAMDADEAYATSRSDEDGVSPSNTQSLSDDVAIELPDDDGTAGLTATFVSFDALGWTDDYTAVKATVGLMPALAIG